jgi:cytochrome P450
MPEPDVQRSDTPVFPFDVEPGLDFPEYGRLLREDPVPLVRLVTGGQAYLVTRYEDVRRVLTDPVFSRAALRRPEVAVLVEGARIPHMLTNMDPPDHTRLRKLIARAFTTRGVEPMRPRAQEITDALIDEMVAAGPPVDFVEAFASPLPALVISEMLGIPRDDRERIHAWVDVTMSTGGRSPQEVAATFEQIMAYLQGLIDEKRATPADDLVSALIATRDEGDRLSEQELLYTVFILIVGGFETTIRLLTNSILMLDAHPDQLARLRDAPEIVPDALDELLRYIPVSVVTMERVTVEDVELGGVWIPAGSTVIPSLYSANRDAAFVAEPDRLDVTRAPLPHLGFGYGVHRCVGAALARLELETAYTTLLRRLPHLRPAQPPATLDWKTGVTTVGPSALPVTW